MLSLVSGIRISKTSSNTDPGDSANQFGTCHLAVEVFGHPEHLEV